MSEPEQTISGEQKRLVWDLPLRLFHWLLAISMGLLWWTQKLGYETVPLIDVPGINVHMWLGYFVLGLIIFRIAWGFVGPRHARFTSFFPLPGRMIAYVKALAFGTESKPVGHNPLGSLMVFLMLALVGAQAVTGLFANDDIFTTGPYNAAVGADTADFLSDLHHRLFDYILIAIAVHVLAIVVYWLVLKQNLVGPMITGRKNASMVPETEAITSSQIIRAVILIVLTAGFIWWLLASAPPPSFDF